MENRIKTDFNFKPTGIGSVPYTNIKDTCLNILKHLPEIPYWPQFVKLSHLENMTIQFSEGLPLLELDEKHGSLAVSSDEMESELFKFYDHFLSDDLSFFAISREYAPGLYEQIELIRQSPEKYGSYIKGQSVGPVTFSAGITDMDGKSVLNNPALLEAYTKGLAIKSLWQVRELAKSGKKTILFLDEPYLSGFGSAFTPIERQVVINLIKEIIDYLRERSDTLIGIHCCGNTDWSMIIETKPDIINFDAFSFMDYFLLYPEDISRFLNDGGAIAWGIVPTADFTEKETVEDLYSRLKYGLNRLKEYNLDPELVARSSLLTPACGMGTMEQSSSDKVLELLSMLSKKMRFTL